MSQYRCRSQISLGKPWMHQYLWPYYLYLQEDKEAMFDVYDTLTGILQVATGVMSTLMVIF